LETILDSATEASFDAEFRRLWDEMTQGITKVLTAHPHRS
jgi:hypothetical protein